MEKMDTRMEQIANEVCARVLANIHDADKAAGYREVLCCLKRSFKSSLYYKKAIGLWRNIMWNTIMNLHYSVQNMNENITNSEWLIVLRDTAINAIERQVNGQRMDILIEAEKVKRNFIKDVDKYINENQPKPIK